VNSSSDSTASSEPLWDADFNRETILELLAESPIPILIVRGPDLRCELTNEAYRELIGGRAIEGKPLLEVIPEAHGQMFAERIRSVMRTGKAHMSRREALESRYADSQQRYWNYIYAPLRNRRGEVDRVVAICSEITEQVRAEEKLGVLARQAEAANRAKDEFLALLGHELRNPLSPITTALQVLRLRRVRLRELDILERQVRHLTRLVDDLLDVSRITRGKIELRRRPLELSTVIRRAIETTSPLLEQRRHELEVHAPTRGLGVHVDPDRLVQVFSNLLTNAAKYSEPGSRIQVIAECDRGIVRVRVRDEGVGITSEMLSKVFDQFVQHPQTLDRSRGGLGLGLSIVKSLVEMHQGRVGATSEGPGKGSEFWLELPAVQVSEGGLASTSELERLSGLNLRRILVVDDNDDAAAMLKQALEELGYRVEVAHDGPTALRTAESFDPEIALLDIGLPVMDGYELAQRLRALKKSPPLHLVAVTGYGQDSDRKRSAEAGFELHLVKPVDLRNLERVVRNLH